MYLGKISERESIKKGKLLSTISPARESIKKGKFFSRTAITQELYLFTAVKLHFYSDQNDQSTNSLGLVESAIANTKNATSNQLVSGSSIYPP